MLILLKLLCFTIWLVIMMYLVMGNNTSFIDYNEVKIRIKDQDDLEMSLRSALLDLKKKDRLIIEDQSDFMQTKRNHFIYSRLLRKNPSLIYSCLSENCGF